LVKDQAFEMFPVLIPAMSEFQKQLKSSDSKEEECFYAMTKLCIDLEAVVIKAITSHINLDEEFQKITNNETHLE